MYILVRFIMQGDEGTTLVKEMSDSEMCQRVCVGELWPRRGKTNWWLEFARRASSQALRPGTIEFGAGGTDQLASFGSGVPRK